MAGSSFFKSMTKVGSVLGLIVSAILLTGCGQGDGPESIAGTAATPPPGGGAGPFDSGLLINGDFEAGVNPWIGNAANVVLDGDNLVNSADVAAAGNPYDVNLSQVLTLTQGETYTLTFKARSNRNRTMEAGIGLSVAPFTSVTETVNLTAAWQTFEFELTAAGFGNANSRVIFDMGADTGLVLIDDVSLIVANGGGDVGTAIDPDAVLYATVGAPDLVIPDDYEERKEIGSGSVIDPLYVDDGSYSPVLSVFSGAGYGANIAEVGFIGFRPGFLGAYETVDFKVKGMPNFVIFVKLFDGVDALRINLTGSAYSADLGDGWFQVSIPVSRFADVGNATGIVFESDDTSLEQFRMLLTDIGFSGVGDNPPDVADPGITPEAIAYSSDPGAVEDLGPPGGIQNFGSGGVFVDMFDDPDFDKVLQVTSGEGYGAGVHVGFAAFTGYAAGFASGYETFHFKVKADAANLGAFEVKFIDNGDTSQTYDLTSYGGVTNLGAGWLQVSIPMSDFAATVAGNAGFLLGPLGDQGAAFSFLTTDIGFSSAGGSGELVIDGGFEAAGASGLQPPWFVFENGGTASVSDVNSNGGTYSARLQADASSGMASFPILKVERLATGLLTDGGPVTVSFDAIDVDNTGVGKVFVAEFFTERSDPPGGATNEVLLDGYGLSGAWQTYSFNTNLGADAAGGVSLLFKADCGANPVCTMDVFIDNVSITIP